MQLFLYFIALVALSSARQLQNGPGVLSEKSSSAADSQKVDKRFVTQEFNIFLTPEEIKALQGVKSSQNSASIESFKQSPKVDQDIFNQQLQNFIAQNLKPAPIEEPQVEDQAPASRNFFLPREESVYNNQKNNDYVSAYSQLLRDQSKLSGQVQNVQNNYQEVVQPLPKSNLVPNVYVSDRAQEEKILHEQLNQQWNRILDHNRAQLKSLSSEQQQNEKAYAEQADSNEKQVQESNRNENQRSELEKEIENIWRQQQAREFENSNSQAEVIRQNEEEEKKEVEKEIEYVLRNHQAYQFGGSNEANEGNIQGQAKNVEEAEIEKQIQNIWRNQQAFQYERSNPVDNRQQQQEGEENQQKSEVDKQIEYILKSRQAEFEKANGEANNQKVEEQSQSEVEKQIENIFRKHQEYELEKSKSAAREISQSPPILIHKHVTITKHLPLPVVKNVQVSVPTPVLVPVPEPYEVRVPHLYPVPLEVVKHVPVPVIRH